MGTPRYVPKDVAVYTLKVSCSICLCSSLVLGEVIIYNLAVLITSSGPKQNSIRIQWVVLALMQLDRSEKYSIVSKQ